MNFLSPWFLAGAFLVIGPIVAHLIRRSTRDRTRFSATRFLEESAPRLERRNRIQHPLLLLLRCLVVALLAAAFARPFFNDPVSTPAAAASTQDVVILLDHSASMRRPGTWRDARQSVYDLTASLRPSDRCALLLASASVQPLLSAEQWMQVAPEVRAQAVRDLLEAREPSWGPTYLDSAIDAALDSFQDGAATSVRRRLIVVSDFAAGSRISGLAARDWPPGLEISLVRTPTPITSNAGLHWLGWSDPENTSRLVRLRVTRDRGSLPLPLTVELRDAVSDAPVGSPVAVELAPGETRLLQLPVPAVASQPLRAHLSGDAEAFDNDVWLPPPVLAETNVVYLGTHDATDAQNALFYVTRALRSARAAKFNVLPFPPDAGADTLPASALYLVHAPLPAHTVEFLRTRLAQGSHVVTLAGSRDMIGTAAALAGEQDWREGPSSERYSLFGRIDFAHALFALFADPRFSDFTTVRFWKPTRLQIPPTSTSRAIATFDDESPALIETIVGRGRHLTFASDWSPRASQWVLSTKFVPWLHALVERATGGPARPQSTDMANLAQLSAAPAAQWSAPVGNSLQRLNQPPASPGVYQLSDETGTRWVGIQVPAEESRTDALPLDAFEQLGVPVRSPASAGTLAAASPAETAAVATEGRQKLWRWLLLGTALLLGLESLLASALSRRDSRPAPAATTA